MPCQSGIQTLDGQMKAQVLFILIKKKCLNNNMLQPQMVTKNTHPTSFKTSLVVILTSEKIPSH